MNRIIASEEQYNTGQFYTSRRHTIQLEFDPYVRGLEKELKAGARRAAARGHALPVEPRALEPA